MVQLHPLGHYVPVYLKSTLNRELTVYILICVCVCAPVCSVEIVLLSLNTSHGHNCYI